MKLFLFISGYLFSVDRITRRDLLRRYKRVLLPYLFFSLLALVYVTFGKAVTGSLAQTDLAEYAIEFFINLLLGNTFGIYYFVFIIVLAYALGFAIVRNPWLSRRLPEIVVLSLALNLLHGAYYQPLLAFLNLEHTWFASMYQNRFLPLWPFFFLAGMLFRRYEWLDYFRERKRAYRGFWFLGATTYSGLIWLGVGDTDGYDSVIATVYAAMTIAFLLTFQIQVNWVAAISRSSYYLYLSHIFFVYAILDLARLKGWHLPFEFNFVSLAVSLLGPYVLFALLKPLLKDRSRWILGA